MTRVNITARSPHVALGTAASEYWRNHHLALLDAHFRRSGITGTIDWNLDVALVTAALPAHESSDQLDLLTIANTVIVATQLAAFEVVKAQITSSLSAWPAGSAGGLIVGARLTPTAEPIVRLIIALAVGAIGALVTSKIRAEIPIYELVPQSSGRLAWRPVPLGAGLPASWAVS